MIYRSLILTKFNKQNITSLHIYITQSSDIYVVEAFRCDLLYRIITKFLFLQF